jgi:isocitrate dehydrogenase kinase/phosphatase
LGCQARLQGEGSIIIGSTDQHLLTLEHFFVRAAQLSIVFHFSLSFFM